jgi:lactococcin 972 family bacteriocin
MKKTLAALAFCSTLLVSTVSVSASSLKSNQGGVDVDSLMNQEAAGSFIIDDSKLNDGGFSVLSVQQPGDSGGTTAGGGIFRVIWGGDRHTSIYDHSYRIHKSSASNSHSTVSSAWQNPRVTASAWIKSSLTGNKANWDVK